MFMDTALAMSSAQAITSSTASTGTYDVTGAGVGNVPNMIFGSTGIAGVDLGAAQSTVKPGLFVSIPTTFTTSNGATLTVGIQAAPDNGSGGAGTWVTIAQTQAFPVASLVQGAVLFMPIPPLPPGFPGLARFYRAYYTVGTGVFTAGALNASFLFNPPSGKAATLYPNNFTVQ